MNLAGFGSIISGSGCGRSDLFLALCSSLSAFVFNRNSNLLAVATSQGGKLLLLLPLSHGLTAAGWGCLLSHQVD